jgi:hypothetical protein
LIGGVANISSWHSIVVLAQVRRSVDGIFFIDVDEFLRPSDTSISEQRPAPGVSSPEFTVSEIAQGWLADPNIGAVALNWAVYGSSGRVEPGDGLVIERFTRRAHQDFSVNRHAKAFVRVDACAGPTYTPHAFVLRSGRYVDTLGQDVEWDTSSGIEAGITTAVTWNVLRVDHFVVKSSAEFAIKRQRRNLLRDENGWQHYFDFHDRNDVEDPASVSLVERTKSEMRNIEALLSTAA